MKKYICYISVVLFVALSLHACQRTKPQSPSNKYTHDNSTEVGVVLLNQRLADEADRQLRQYVSQNALSDFVLTESGVWLKHKQVKKPTLTQNERVTIHYSISDLQGNTLLDDEQTVIVGKNELIAAISDMMPLMTTMDSATLLAPWHQAYGAVGTKFIPAYTNVKIELQTL